MEQISTGKTNDDIIAYKDMAYPNYIFCFVPFEFDMQANLVH